MKCVIPPLPPIQERERTRGSVGFVSGRISSAERRPRRRRRKPSVLGAYEMLRSSGNVRVRVCAYALYSLYLSHICGAYAVDTCAVLFMYAVCTYIFSTFYRTAAAEYMVEHTGTHTQTYAAHTVAVAGRF